MVFKQDAVNATGGNNGQPDNAGANCDLSTLDPLCNDSDEFLRQLAENPFELDSFFTEYTAVDVKVFVKRQLHSLSIFKLLYTYHPRRRKTITCRISPTRSSF